MFANVFQNQHYSHVQRLMGLESPIVYQEDLTDDHSIPQLYLPNNKRYDPSVVFTFVTVSNPRIDSNIAH